MSDVAIIGDIIQILPFTQMGIDVYAVDESDKDSEEFIREILHKKYKIILVIEKYYVAVSKEIEAMLWAGRERPVVLPIPDGIETHFIGEKILKERITQATGIDMFKEENKEE